VGTPGFDGLVELKGFLAQRDGQVVERRHQLVDDVHHRRHVDGRGEHVVGRLRCVDVVVRVHRAAETLLGQRGDHLVGVHVGRGARAGLEDVDRELVVPLSLGDVGGGLRDGLRHVGVEHAQLAVHLRGHGLDQTERRYVGRFEPAPGYREVLHSPLCLRSPLGRRRDSYFAHRVMFDPEILHDSSFALRAAGCVPAGGLE
jgi:hypothetical protein